MRRRSLRHVDDLTNCHRDGYQPAVPVHERQTVRQEPRLTARRRTQMAVLALTRVALAHGHQVGDVARELGIGPGTIYTWMRRWRDMEDRLQPTVRGAPQYTCTRQERFQVHLVIDLFGTDISVACLVRIFPEIARRELARLLHGRRAQLWRDGGPRVALRTVRWHGVGQVWAMDFTELDAPDALGRRYALVVRDLASRYLLACEPCWSQDQTVVLAVLGRLLIAYDAPLVIKADNGSHFRNAAVEALLLCNGIVPLWSPPYYPRFNGAIEAGIGRWKDRLRIIATRDDHALGVTADHMEGARLQANASGEASDGEAPATWWDRRHPIPSAWRKTFQQLVREHQQRIETVLRTKARVPQPAVAEDQPDEITWSDAAQRRAVIAALAEAGVVHIRSRRVHQPDSRRRSA
jgi:transposase InsO family protein